MAVTRTYQAVLARIEDDLAQGRLDIGGRLPGERVLAERYSVSRASVREAIRVLEAMGLIRTAAGSGPDAGATVIADPAAGIGAALRWHLASRHLPVADIVGARVLIESWAVGEAARRCLDRVDDSGLVAVRSLLEEMSNVDLPVQDFLALDALFHVELAGLAGNVVVAAVMSAMREGIRMYVTQAVAGIADWPGMAGTLRSEHAGILRAVVGGLSVEASARVSAHIQGFYLATGVG